MIYVAETMAEAARDVRQAANVFYTVSNGRLWENDAAAKRTFLEAGEELSAEDCDADWYDFLSAHDVIWIGSADYVAEKIERFRRRWGCRTSCCSNPFLACLTRKS